MAPYVNALYLEGLLLGIGLFAAPGPKDTLVIRQGVSRGPIWGVVAICIFADVLLIALGITGLGSLLESRPTLVALLLLSGAAYLLWFVLLALGCQRLTVLFRTPLVWRWLDAGVAMLMVYLAWMLITGSLDVFEIALECLERWVQFL